MKEDIKRVLDENARGNFYSDLFRLKLSEEIEKIVNKSLKTKNNDVKSGLPNTNKTHSKVDVSDIPMSARAKAPVRNDLQQNSKTVNETIKNKITTKNKVDKSVIAKNKTVGDGGKGKLFKEAELRNKNRIPKNNRI